MYNILQSPKSKVQSPNIKLKILLFSLFTFLFSANLNAQCAMCRAALGGDGNKAQAQAVNDGIVYLMIIPYVLVAAIGYAVYRMRKKKVK